jgi:hypothetical protein
LDVNPHTGTIQIHHPNRMPWEVPAGQSCVLDMAEAGELTLEETGEILNFTRERARQIEVRALLRLRVHARRVDDERGGAPVNRVYKAMTGRDE